MRLEAPERLLDTLIRHPDGVSAPAAAPEADAARHELQRRGHCIDVLAADAASEDRTRPAAASWRLRCARQHFAPQRFAQQRGSRLGATLQVWEECDSTNDLANAGARGGAPHGALWWAEAQREGRGRQGRHWSCPAHQGLLFSILLRPEVAHVERAQLLPLAVALGVCEGLRAATQSDVRIKWPNDLILDGAKLGGILVEARFAVPAFVVVGCGLNVRVDAARLQREGVPRPASLHTGCEILPGREALLARVLAGIETRYDAWREARDAWILEPWSRYDVLRDRPVGVCVAGHTYRGIAAGIAADGSLEVRLHDGSTRHFAAGEVHLT